MYRGDGTLRWALAVIGAITLGSWAIHELLHHEVNQVIDEAARRSAVDRAFLSRLRLTHDETRITLDGTVDETTALRQVLALQGRLTPATGVEEHAAAGDHGDDDGTAAPATPRSTEPLLADITPPPTATLLAATPVGDVRGRVVFVGTPPSRTPLARPGDPYCAQQPPQQDESVLVDAHGGLANVVVRILDAGGASGAAPPPGRLEYDACAMRPRVQTVLAGETFVVANRDRTLHDVHAVELLGQKRTLFNFAMVPGAPPVEKRFTANVQLLEIGDDVHSWERAFVYVTDSPFAAVTAADGTFRLRDVPAGARTLELWHERYGRITAKMTVQAGRTVVVTPLEFRAP